MSPKTAVTSSQLIFLPLPKILQPIWIMVSQAAASWHISSCGPNIQLKKKKRFSHPFLLIWPHMSSSLLEEGNSRDENDIHCQHHCPLTTGSPLAFWNVGFSELLPWENMVAGIRVVEAGQPVRSPGCRDRGPPLPCAQRGGVCQHGQTNVSKDICKWTNPSFWGHVMHLSCWIR